MNREKQIFGFAFGLYELSDIDKELLDEDFFIKSLEFNPLSFKYMPDEYKTDRVCEKIKERLKERAKCLTYDYVQSQINDPLTYHSLVEVILDQKTNFLTKELCEKVISHAGSLIGHIPKEFMSTELAILAFETYKYVIMEIDDIYISRDLCIKSLNVPKFAALQYVPKKLIDKEIIDIAMSCNKDNIKYVPKEYMTTELIEQLLDENGLYLKYVPKESKTKELCEKAINKTPGAFVYVPEKYLTIEMCYNAVLNDPSTIVSVPKKYLEEVKTKIIEKYHSDFNNEELNYGKIEKLSQGINSIRQQMYLQNTKYDFSEVQPLENLFKDDTKKKVKEGN